MSCGALGSAKDSDIIAIIDNAMQVFPTNDLQAGSHKPCRGFLVSAEKLRRNGLAWGHESSENVLLLLGGTGLSISDRKELIVWLIKAGIQVASVEHRSHDFSGHPGKQRQLALRVFLKYLAETGQVEQVDVAAQSYAAFEVIREMMAAPRHYRRFIRNIILINPPGFNEHTGFFRHCCRYVCHHLLKGYARMLLCLCGAGNQPFAKNDPHREIFIRRELHGITRLNCKLMKNLFRTLKETRDIVTFRLAQPVRILQDHYGFSFFLFLNSDDQLIPYQTTLNRIRGILPPTRVKIVPGGHIDLFFQEWQRPSFLRFLEQILQAGSAADN